MTNYNSHLWAEVFNQSIGRLQKPADTIYTFYLCSKPIGS